MVGVMPRVTRSVFERAFALWHSDEASAIAEYALVMTFFSLASLLAITLVGQTANNSVDTDETNFSNSMVIGN